VTRVSSMDRSAYDLYEGRCDEPSIRKRLKESASIGGHGAKSRAKLASYSLHIRYIPPVYEHGPTV
jgi:hypothetical protein